MSAARRTVAVRGVGMTAFGRQPGETDRSLAEEAVHLALRDADLDPAAVDAAWLGNVTGGQLGGQMCALGQLALRPFGLGGLPVTRVEAACASGSVAVRSAYLAVASGEADVALAFGAEHMTRAPTKNTIGVLAGASDLEAEARFGVTFPGVFGMIARRHMDVHGTTPAQLAAVTVKNRANGARNPVAQFDEPVTVEDVLAARRVATPLGLLDCCAISDGAAAVLVVAEHLARPGDPRIVASAQTSSAFEPFGEMTGFALTREAARQAYAQAGISADDVDLAEVHDCFSIAEVLHTEDLGFCGEGEGGPFVESGATAIGGTVAVNPSGGLGARGHPIGATGCAQVGEAVLQLRGDAGARQVDGARIALTHTLGAFVHGAAASCAVHVLAA
ncbi:beta-ketoacyl synthase N-terminal-like domain-containing protein [Conexibacter sp. SYSU D00693]|uniref:thiolase C-terminal domain-containing protein n=1 Tax=Conexibacter sp. SYSU D00693 TaxID=2812560 RepID=UPI00196AED61|nr:beta-ketoacyl synthase N-terminal-like domain-containing protein [Conexibacter sp. SYSU D00693]